VSDSAPQTTAAVDQTLLPTRREFLIAGTSALLAGAAPAILGAEDKSGTRPPVIGERDFQFECQHDWAQAPVGFPWYVTHGVTIDRDGMVYIKHRALKGSNTDTILVFDPAGRFVRSFGSEYCAGGHGIDIREENGQEFLYLSDTFNRQVVKTDLNGEWIWKIRYPREAGVYEQVGKFSPTNVCFAPDGGFYVGDGYGSNYIHQYDQDARWVRTWGGTGSEPGKMKTPHGLWLDERPGREPSLVVADRANARLQYFTLDGQHLSFVEGLSFPANIDIQGPTMLVPDLHARITLLDAENKVLTHLGYDQAWTETVLADNMALRKMPSKWEPGRFLHPHDACFDKAGNIFVAEWVEPGRVTFLRRV
jgi:hypothetical protein